MPQRSRAPRSTSTRNNQARHCAGCFSKVATPSPERCAPGSATSPRRSGLDEGGRECSPLLTRCIRALVDDLDADMVRAGVTMLLHAFRDLRLIAPRDECVDEPIAATVGEVVVTEAEPTKV